MRRIVRGAAVFALALSGALAAPSHADNPMPTPPPPATYTSRWSWTQTDAGSYFNYGVPLHLSGGVMANGEHLDGTLTLQARPAGQTTFHTVETFTGTSLDVMVTPTRRTSYRAVYSGGHDTQGDTWTAITSPIVTLTPDRTVDYHYRGLSTWGTVQPAVPHGRVRVTVTLGSRRVRAFSVPLRRGRRYRFAVPGVPCRSVVTYRIPGTVGLPARVLHLDVFRHTGGADVCDSSLPLRLWSI